MRTRNAPYFGRGIAFPFRINPATGSVQVTEGNADAVSVALQYLNENWTIREDTNPRANLIAEAVAHILLTRPLEHDTLPPFGSYMFKILFEPNTEEFEMTAEEWFLHATERWEKRVAIKDVEWHTTDLGIDHGRIGAMPMLQFIRQQVSGNLVSPMVTPREARNAEYPVEAIDANTHDYFSRYWKLPAVERDGYRISRFPRQKTYPFMQDDEWYTVTHGDTWLLISWKLYDDIRYWPILAQVYVQDESAAGATREVMDPSHSLEVGQIIRVPSRSRVLMELSN